MGFHGRSGALWRVAAVALVFGGTASGALTAGASADAGDASSSQPVAVAGSWTVLEYSMADTNLEPFMMDDVNEMGEVGSNENLNIVALIDRSPQYGEDPVLDIGDWVGAKFVHIQPGHAEVLADLGPTDMGDPATLSWFITEGIAAFPAEHYAVIINDHGAAWPGVGPDESAESLVGTRRDPVGTRNRARRRRCRAARPAGLRRLPDGGVRGRQRPRAVRRSARRQLGGGARQWVGLPDPPTARRRPGRHRRRPRHRHRRQLHRRERPQRHAGTARPHADAAARRGDGGVHVRSDRAIGDGGARRRAHPGGQPGLRQESRPDPGPLHDRPRHPDRLDRRRGARRVRSGRRRAASVERRGGPQGLGRLRCVVLGPVDLLPAVGRPASTRPTWTSPRT